MSKSLLVALALLIPATPSYADSTSDKQAFKQAYSTYQSAIESGDNDAAIASAEAAYTAGLKLFGDKHKNSAALALNYGRLLKGKPAQEILKEALQLHENVYGGKAIELLDPLMDLAANSQSKPAERLYSRALNIAKNKAPLDAFLIATLYTHLGQTALDQQKPKALHLLNKAEKLLLEIDGKDAEVTLAMVRFNKGKYQLAKRKFKSATGTLLTSLSTFEKYAPDGQMTMINHSFLIRTMKSAAYAMKQPSIAKQ